jgi:hypothetical protein
MERVGERKDFSRTKILVLLAVLVMFAGFGGYYLLMKRFEDGYCDKTKVKLLSLTHAAETYKLNNGEFPPSIEAFTEPQPNGFPPLASRDEITDRWSNLFGYDPDGPHNDGHKPDIWVNGPNGPIGNWPGSRSSTDVTLISADDLATVVALVVVAGLGCYCLVRRREESKLIAAKITVLDLAKLAETCKRHNGRFASGTEAVAAVQPDGFATEAQGEVFDPSGRPVDREPAGERNNRLFPDVSFNGPNGPTGFAPREILFVVGVLGILAWLGWCFLTQRYE